MAAFLAVVFLAVSAFAQDFDPKELVMFGDMAVEKSALPPPGSEKTDAATPVGVKFWENGVLPIEFASDITPTEKASFFAACSVWGRAARIQCREGSVNGKTLKVGKGLPGCWSLLGEGYNFKFFRRRMNLGEGCWVSFVIIHELGHSLGFLHEHQREDRDRYVTVFPENLMDNYLNLQYRINFATEDFDWHTPYDFFSIMHYDRKAFSKNGKDTITPKPAYAQFGNVMGTARTLSSRDKALAAAIYGDPD